jgi:hypothetical protein
MFKKKRAKFEQLVDKIEPAPFTLCKCFFYSTSFYLLYLNNYICDDDDIVKYMYIYYSDFLLSGVQT